MLKHENPNIEIINENLWAVRYSLIPLIPQIDYKPDPAIPLEHLPSQISPNGVVVLNKDFKWYEILQKNSVIAMKLTTKQIKKEITKKGRVLAETPAAAVYRYCLKVELERRKIKKGGVT
ncbi:hypothetical protein [Lawsonibacter sp. JLR.KK007]|uniref:hypothetical protein n=1 Tax=Lawsonibacter sp. JLR.KK007 TaxID=3114293 RepID=UPI002FF0B492